jgi:carbon starvation protein
VHDMVVLFASVRHKGQSISVIAEKELGAAAGKVASVAVLFILILTLAGLSIAVVNAMFNSPWGTFTVFATIPIAMVMGIYMRAIRPGDIKGMSLIGVVLLMLSLYAGPYVAENPTLAAMLTFSKKELSIIVPTYGFFASVLPVWFLLVPRDYLSTYLKIGTIAALAIGIMFVNPALQMPALTEHIIGSGTTPKMIENERDILFVGYGAMLTEGFVAMMALIAACVLVPADYFAINALPAAFAKLGMTPVNLPELAAQVGEEVQGRPGGAVSLAVGMAYIFSAVPFMKGMMAYWYHFAIMFEAVFILTAVDAGTRVGRYLLQEMLGRVYKPFNNNSWIPGIVVCSSLFTGAWGYLVYTGDISTIWPLFGMANQLLASCALIVGTTMLIRLGKARYAWTTAIPGLLVWPTVMWAGYLNVVNNYLPKQLYLLTTMSVTLMVLISIVFVAAFRQWATLLKIEKTVKDAFGDEVLATVNEA